MFSKKNAVIQQVASAIKKKWSNECKEILDNLFISTRISHDTKTDITDYSNTNNYTLSIKRIKERIELLEESNDNLNYTLYLLVENLPELICKTILSDPDICKKLNGLNNNDLLNPADRTDVESVTAKPHPTRREMDILALLEKGYCAKEIANRLFISETTVISHKKNLKKKFNVKNTVELISLIKSRK
jgi:DNA-binding CsgD family transcriptional regulator